MKMKMEINLKEHRCHDIKQKSMIKSLKLFLSKFIITLLIINTTLVFSRLFVSDLRAIDCQDSSNKVSEYNFNISYLGVNVANVSLTDERNNNNGTLSILARSTGAGSFLFPINNRYYIHYIDDYLPVVYLKKIEQRRFSIEKSTHFNRDANRVEIIQEDNQHSIQIHNDGRDFFCSLFHLNNRIFTNEGLHSKHNNNIVVYANNNYWQADYEYLGTDQVNGVNAHVYQITLVILSDNEYQRSDVLTNNLIKNNSVVKLWFSSREDKLPVKAEFKSSPFSVYWHLE